MQKCQQMSDLTRFSIYFHTFISIWLICWSLLVWFANLQKVSYIVCVIGLVFSVLFHVFVHEPAYQPKPRRVRPSVFTVETKRYLSHTRGSQGIITLLANQKEEPTSGSRTSISYTTDPKEFERRLKAAKKSAKQWHHWFKSLSFWKITLMYTLARMFVNVTQVYTTLYLQDYLQLRKVTQTHRVK